MSQVIYIKPPQPASHTRRGATPSIEYPKEPHPVLILSIHPSIQPKPATQPARQPPSNNPKETT